MGFFASLFQWFGLSAKPREVKKPPARQTRPQDEPPSKTNESSSSTPVSNPVTSNAVPSPTERTSSRTRQIRLRLKPRLTPTRYDQIRRRNRSVDAPYKEVRGATPYRYARYGSLGGSHLDLSLDGDDGKLLSRGLPVMQTPEQIANWLEIPLNKVAWLVHRFTYGRPDTVAKSHYHYNWQKKSSGGWRLIEAPKATLKQVQEKILREILDLVPAHPAAHGFVRKRSVMTNALPHVGHATLIKLDLENFYTTVGFNRVVAIFRSLGYSREAGIWLGLLTTSSIPINMAFPAKNPYAFEGYWGRHLPQGAPTSPALANLSAYRLDIRLAGLSRSFGATYTRYADDLAISGPRELSKGLRVLIPLVQQIIRRERFRPNIAKRRVLRAHQRQVIAGVVVNEKTNVSRADFDRLKATLTNCIRLGPSTQNHAKVEDFAAHLRGRIAHVTQLNLARGEKLMTLFSLIDWQR